MEGENIALENLAKEVAEIKGRMNTNETEVTNIKIAMGKSEEKLSQVFQILIDIKDSIKTIASKLDVIEKTPGQRWEVAVRTVLTVVVSCVITWFLTK